MCPSVIKGIPRGHRGRGIAGRQDVARVWVDLPEKVYSVGTVVPGKTECGYVELKAQGEAEGAGLKI